MDFPAVVLLAATLPAPRLKTLVLVLLFDTVWEFIKEMSQSEVYDGCFRGIFIQCGDSHFFLS